jgi:hypothetical protein
MTDITVREGNPVQVSPVSGAHRAYLNEHAVTDEVIRETKIFSLGDDLVFPWKDGDETTAQLRRWPPPDDEFVKYRWQQGRPLHFGAWRPAKDPEDGQPPGPVIIAEGTKQSLAVASWAPAEYAVYGMAGCWGWRNRPEMGGTAHHRLSRFAGRAVFVILDADASDNLDVYEAGEKLAAELALEDAASVAFVRMPGQGKEGIDDYLAAIDGPRRTERLAKLLAAAVPTPADRRPTKRKISEEMPDTGGLPLVIVNGDRRALIHTVIGQMQQRWAGQQLFSYGGVMARLRDARIEPLDPGAFANWLIETVSPYKYTPPGAASPGKYEAAWPDTTTMSAMMARGDEFPALTRISQTPFIRSDGSVCAKNGFDPETGTMLIMGNSGMDRLDIPDSPTQAHAATAASFLLDTWLGDFPFRDESSRANTLALALTPFIRGIVPLVPLAVVSGLQMGVGKNLMADCIAGLVTGTPDIAPMPFMPDDDEENAKKIHSAFREGYTLMCFDEAHKIGGSSLTRAITAQTYQDRILGVSKMASYPNNVTWIALGNQVQVLADMARRAYFIELWPEAPDPQDRDSSWFRIEDPRTWTCENRPELVTAALVMVRAWFAAGQPPRPRGTLMGSFETWDKLMSGILGHAGVPGFLGNLAARRAERDTTGGFWEAHLDWLRTRFGTDGFTASDVQAAALSSGGAWEAPPHLEDPGHPSFARSLGLAYRQVQERTFGGLFRLVRGEGTAHRRVAKWYVEYRGGHATPPSPEGGPVTPPVPGSGFSGGSGGSQSSDYSGPVASPVMPAGPVGGTGGSNQSYDSARIPSGDRGPANAQGGRMDQQTLPDLGERGTAVNSLQAPAERQTLPDLGGRPVVEGVEGVQGLLLPDSNVHARAHTHTHVREGELEGVPTLPALPPGPALGFDIETADANDLFRCERGYRGEDGTGFVRLCGIIGPSGERRIVSVRDLLAMTGAAGSMYGHNVMGFDGPALTWHEGLDWQAFWPKARDTEIIARQANPPRSRESGSSEDKYDLDHVAEGLGIEGKTGDIRAMARQHGGYDKIPVTDPQYRSYLYGDLGATAGVGSRLLPHYDTDPYLPREHRVAAIASQMTLNGFAVDRELLAQRAEQTSHRKRQALQLLHDGWGLPLTKTVMRGRGAARHEEHEPMESPLATDAGRDWLAGQWERAGITNPPRTGTGKLALGSEELRPIARDRRCGPELRSMLALMDIVTGSRTVYQTATDWLCPDGRVHARNSMRQASGRWSVTSPGLTVFGKRGGKHVEREIYVPDPGHVLISADLSQVDMRGIAALCQDPAYMALFGFEDDGTPRDAHKWIAGQLGISRQDAKARGHGWNYGLGPKRMIAEGADPEVVFKFVNGMERQFPVLCAWREGIRADGKAGKILDNGWGRRMRAEPSRAYTVAPALMGQGSARDIMCEALLRLPAWVWPFLRAMVHDEIVLSVPVAAVQDVIAVLREAMTFEWRNVPILCDISAPGANWGDISAK